MRSFLGGEFTAVVLRLLDTGEHRRFGRLAPQSERSKLHVFLPAVWCWCQASAALVYAHADAVRHAEPLSLGRAELPRKPMTVWALPGRTAPMPPAIKVRMQAYLMVGPESWGVCRFGT